MKEWWFFCPSCLNGWEDENPGPHHMADDEGQIPDCGTEPIVIAPQDYAQLQKASRYDRARAEVKTNGETRAMYVIQRDTAINERDEALSLLDEAHATLGKIALEDPEVLDALETLRQTLKDQS